VADGYRDLKHPPQLMTETNERPDQTRAPQGRQRARRADVHIAREALKVAKPANEQIGPWQERAARLFALAQRGQIRGKQDPSTAAEARALLEAVTRRRLDLQQSIETLPVAVARSSRLDDTVKALDSITNVLERAISLSAGPTG